MKRKLGWSIVAVGIVALLIAVGYRNSAAAEDVPLTRAAEMVESYRYGPDVLHRAYSLHMDYDAAVIEMEKELAGKGWTEKSTYVDTRFSGAGGSRVTITRCKPVIVNDVSELYTTGVFPNLPELKGVDPHGWVMIETLRHVPTGRFLYITQMRLLSFLHVRRKAVVSYAPLPKSDILHDPVDVHRGTRGMESSVNQVIGVQL